VPLLALLTGCASNDVAVPVCEADLRPLIVLKPNLPPAPHDVEGYAVVRFIVTTKGLVQSPQIERWSAAALGAAESAEYKEAILFAVSRWRYTLRPRACSTTTKINL
jgi:hypothetical protein